MPDKETKEYPKMNAKSLNGLGVEICDDQAAHLFSNFILTICNDEEIVLGFGNRKIPNINKIDIKSYFHLTIPHLKRLSKLLAEKVAEIERKEK